MNSLILALLIVTQHQCDSIRHYNILTIGDSNGASPIGWIYQLGMIRTNDKFYNCSIGGNTIGFDNLGKDTLNTLKNINQYIKNAEDSLIYLDRIMILLGTNDCKAVFDSLQTQVPQNLEKLVQMIEYYPFKSLMRPEIILITPPPIAQDSMLLPKYYGGQQRLENLLPHFRYISEKYRCTYIDIYHPLNEGFIFLTTDGIHLNEAGQKKAAEIINQEFEKLRP